MPYAELLTTSNFSFLRGGSHPEEFVSQAAALNYRAIGLSDINSLAGVVRGHVEAQKHEISFLVGSRLVFTRDAVPFSLVVYPTNRAAYGALSRLLTTGKRRAAKGECDLSLEDLQGQTKDLQGIIDIENFRSPHKAFLELAKELFTKDALSLAFSNIYSARQKQKQERILSLSKDFELPLLATNNAYYHSPQRRALQDVLTCIRNGCTIKDAGLKLLANSERFLKPVQEIERLFRHQPQAISRALEVAECASGFSLSDIKYEYPREICPEGKTPDEQLRELSYRGAKEKYPTAIPEKVSQLIERELQLVSELEYAKYFLTVYDIVQFAKKRGILCQGRGAAANSAICYCLGITAVDPDKIRLFFERFISKERNEPPDIDIDFEHERREEVIQYIYQKYGRLRSALVSEVISYRTKSAVRDVGKALGLSNDAIVALRKTIQRTEEEITAEILRNNGLAPEEKNIWLTIELSQELKTFPRHLSQHVGGFIISDQPLCEIVPIENAAMADRTVIEWDKDDVDAMGMLKIDVLGLGMLTCIRKTFALINEDLPEERKLNDQLLKLHTIPREDPAVYEMICKADTIGVFQIESRAQMSMLPRLRPKEFYDLVVQVAIVRPGPIQGGMVHPYIRRRNGLEAIRYPNKEIEKVLGRTLGVPIFQEQIMELSVVAAGFSAGESDNLRRAMSSWKKNKSLIGQFGEKMMRGMLARGYSREFAQRCLSQIKGFSEYGFPQSHAASFALLAYVSAWLKKHYPAAFAAGLLNSQPMGFYQAAQIIQDAKRHGVSVDQVDINHSAWDSRVSHAAEPKQSRIRLGMRLIRGLRKLEAEKIIACVAQSGHYRCAAQLWRDSGASAATFRTLARADAFSSMNLSRQQALWEMQKFKDQHLPLFDGPEYSTEKEQEPPPALPPISEEEEVYRDYEQTGLSLKAHPMSFYREQLQQHQVHTAEEIKDRLRFPQGKKTIAAGIVLVRQRPMTASGVVFVTIEDETGILNLIIKPDVFRRYQRAIVDSCFLAARGKVQREGLGGEDGEVLHLIVEQAWDLAKLQKEQGKDELRKMSRDFH